MWVGGRGTAWPPRGVVIQTHNANTNNKKEPMAVSDVRESLVRFNATDTLQVF